ncbi:acetyl/propionyl/methylcrotonyl-CoA carboxylase subunit alpha [Falsiroseomonas sp. HC035]|uniref:acetyl/propionyl/methylcrotonyl-CoA carboxylase subunit alpha n=1 Tax=Falsiroseomonas sp. HC035 TaxID=3390999 RepID=UPI003D31ED71
MPHRPFDSLLVANRGEIAARILRTARRMGLRGIAVFSDADAGAVHVAEADAAVRIGPAPARESYLHIPAILAAARAVGAEAIHPGYGFLSENADFAEAVLDAGLVWVGPPPAAIRAMGSKAAAKALMEQSGVPLVPGYHGEDQSDATLHAAAQRIGFPLLVKASAGGGGKGMKVAASAAELEEALALARGEARAAFGDDRLLLERYLQQPRHIEIQVFGDSHGNIIHLHERDCSLQRRHQKVVEEAPAPGMTAARRAAMGQAACAAARAVGYVGAGTVEFIATEDTFHFMEMNTRLQVEHPVTEAITGLDLVEWQLRIAMGEALPLAQAEVPLEGHAIEVRLYAEDPTRDFAPSTGTLRHLALPQGLPGTRVDAGVRTGDVVPIHYDPMLAKIIVHGPDRATALRRMDRALAVSAVAGIRTNLPLLRGIVAHSDFRAGALDTGFIARHAEALLAPQGPAPRAALAAALLRLLRDAAGNAAADPYSPWGTASAWRLNGAGYQDFVLLDGAARLALRAHPGAAPRLELPDGVAEAGGLVWSGDRIGFTLDGQARQAVVLREGAVLSVLLDGATHELQCIDTGAASGNQQEGGGKVLAPMPGRVLQLLVAEGETVQRGAVLLVMEAMKVQMRIPAPADGVVLALNCAVGDLVEDGAELAMLGPLPD